MDGLLVDGNALLQHDDLASPNDGPLFRCDTTSGLNPLYGDKVYAVPHYHTRGALPKLSCGVGSFNPGLLAFRKV